MLINLSDDKADIPLNQHIEDCEKKIIYTTIVDVCTWILELQLKWIFTADVKDAFHQIPIWRQQIKYVGIKICGMIFFWTTLVFGLASSCNIWGEFAALVTWITINNELDLFLWRGKKLLLQYADDWLGGPVTKDVAWRQYEKVKYWWNKLGIPYDENKLGPPSQEQEYIGYILYIDGYSLGITKRRMKKYMVGVDDLLSCYGRNKRNIMVQVRRVRTLIGQLRSLTVVYELMIPWIRPFEKVICKFDKKTDGFKMISLKERHKQCLLKIKEMLMDHQWSKRKMYDVIGGEDRMDAVILTDASTKKGMGGFIQVKKGDFFKIMWDELNIYRKLKKKPDIIWMELAAVVTAIRIFGKQFEGMRILVRCDNSSSVGIIKRKTSCLRRTDLLKLVEMMCDDLRKYRIELRIKHIKGIKNVVADKLSRNREDINFDLNDEETQCRDVAVAFLKTFRDCVDARSSDMCDCTNRFVCDTHNNKI